MSDPPPLPSVAELEQGLFQLTIELVHAYERTHTGSGRELALVYLDRLVAGLRPIDRAES